MHGVNPSGGLNLQFALLFSVASAAAAILALVPVRPANAIPAYTDQTQLPCQACHVGGFGPQLTPFGREFKLDGYTLRTKASVPLSGMAVASFTHTAKDQVPPPEHFSPNDNLAFDEGSVFVAGGLGKHLGGFTEITYEGADRAWALDMLDWRAVTKGKLFGADTSFGLTFNNGPTIQDAWNTTPIWGFPYTGEEAAEGPSAAPLIDGALMGNSFGLSGYAWMDHKVYAEAGAYSSPSAGTLRWIGADPEDPGNISGLAPYGRFAWQGKAGGGTLEVGAFALKAHINPARDMTSGLTDRYSDVGLDASWQKVVGRDTLSAQARYVHESKNLEASCALGMIGDGSTPNCADVNLTEWRGDVGYHWRDKLGATVGAFSITGDSNANLYEGPAASPDSNGIVLQLDYSPWGDGKGPLDDRVNLQVGAQFTAYGKFDGASHNYNGAGANASDNDTVRLYTWLAF